MIEHSVQHLQSAARNREMLSATGAGGTLALALQLDRRQSMRLALHRCTPMAAGLMFAGFVLTLASAAHGADAEGAASEALCGVPSQPPFCSAVRGARAEGWLEQTRSEVMATHGMVVTS